MPPNILLVILDTVRARNTSVYGHTNETTPFLTEFAERATQYKQARAPAARSLDSHVSIFTGLHVEEHGVVHTGDKLAPGHTLWESLADSGYATGVFSENNWITDIDAGLKDAFQHVEGPRNIPFSNALDPTTFVAEEGQGQYSTFIRRALDSNQPVRSLINGVSTKLQSDHPAFLLQDSVGTHGSTYTDLFLDWEANQNQPWAACVNYMDAHHPYEPEARFDIWGGRGLQTIQRDIEDVKWEFAGNQRPWWQRRALEPLYDGCIRQLDNELRRLIRTLSDRSDLENTLVVITSDHGEGFGDVSRVRPDARVASHSVAIHECLLHVPLIVQHPGQEDGKTVQDVVSLTDFPTAVETVIESDETNRPFVTDRPVIATAHGLDTPVQERASEYIDDFTPYTETTRAVYEQDENGVRKHVTWRDNEATIAVRDAQTAWKVSEDGGEPVRQGFNHISELNVKQDSSADLGKRSVQQLKDLGYM